MNQEVEVNNAGSVTRLRESTALKLVYLLQALFLLSALFALDAPFLSVHFDRQNQTFDIANEVLDCTNTVSGIADAITKESNFVCTLRLSGSPKTLP